MLRKVAPDHVMCGDDVIINAHSGKVKYIDGPDHRGTYDIHLVDKNGQVHIEIVNGTVTLSV